MAPGARSKFSAPMFEPEVFWKQMYCIEESTCDIVGTFRRPSQSFGARGIVSPLLRSCADVTPLKTKDAVFRKCAVWSRYMLVLVIK